MMHYQHPYRKRQDSKVCENQSCEAYLALVQQHKVSLRPGTTPYMDITLVSALCLLLGLSISFPVLDLMQTALFYSVYVSYGTWPTPLLYLFLLRGKGLLWLQHRGAQAVPPPHISCKMGATGHRDQFSLLMVILLCLLYVFHPVPV